MLVADWGAALKASRDGLGRPLWLATLALALCWLGTATANATTLLHYSQTPSQTEPYAACSPPTPNSAQCLAIVDPKGSAPTSPTREAGSSLEAAPTNGNPEIFCSEVFIGSEYEYCGTGGDHGFSPQDLESAYKLPSSTAGSGQTVAIVDAYDDPNAQADLNVYRSTYDLPPCEAGCFTKINQEGGPTYPAASESWALEISLDLDMVSAACPKCHILLVEAKNNELTNLGIAENEAAKWEEAETKQKATEISNSYAANEKEVGKTQLETDSKYYQHPGIPITVAGGDNSWDNTNPCFDENNKCINVAPNYPAGLSTVVAVGGTNLMPEGTSGRGWHESVWYNSGSGCTLYVTKPAWQTDKGCTNRTDNDVAAVASPTTPVSVYDTYPSAVPGWELVGGTSASTPLVAGAIALESATLRSEGTEGIYKHLSNWFDVTEGINHPPSEKCSAEYICQGEVGYDGPTGVGTPSGGATATPPGLWTENASAVTTSGGTLNGIVNPESGAETTYYFQYGASTYYGRTTASAKVSGYTQPTRVSQALSGLKPSTQYHFRVVAQNTSGTTYGADKTVSTAPEVYFSKFGTKGAAEGQLNEPQFTATNAEGDIWVSDYVNDRVEAFSPTGAFIRSCGKAGSGEVQFNGPTGIALNPGGHLYVSDSGNNRIEVISQTCGYVSSFGKSYLSDPMGLAFSSTGEFDKALLLVANAGDDTISEFNWAYTEPKLESTYGSKGSGEGQFSDPTDVILGGKENATTDDFYVVDSGNNRVQEFSEGGLSTSEGSLTYKFVRAFGSGGSGQGQFTSPTAIALDPTTGDLDVTDTGNSRVEQFLPTGSYVSTFGSAGSGNSSFSKPRGIVASPELALSSCGPGGRGRLTVRLSWDSGVVETLESSLGGSP